ncbi:unnamed protein product [Adineta ricciae]|uniref:G-protein coupled receptors family 1 profile domain-containing protein n=1 Tax=Adineta ricciae TaxID=249248 RepID=A0A815NVV8_ADIRI|nr:unnamed protein product [Adineta ricciae]CAF1642969.1 unnamed protein product [Adineta ricciae]
MFDERLSELVVNITLHDNNPYQFWFFINDSLIILGNIIAIFVAFLFVITIIRLDHPTYSISNLIACNTSLAIGLTSSIMLINACYALKSDFRGYGHYDSFCVLRGTLLNICYIYMYMSLCLKAFNRLRCIIYNANPIIKSYGCLFVLLLIKLLVAILVSLFLVLTDGIDYDWNSYLCLVTDAKTYHFIFMLSVYYISILFITSVYLYILYYVLHLPLLERYRRKRQLAVLRRILILLIMLIIPGVVTLFIIIWWMIFGSIPLYSLRIRTLFDAIGYTGSIITIFISHTKLREQYYTKKKINVNQIVLKKFPFDKCELIVMQTPPPSPNIRGYL